MNFRLPYNIWEVSEMTGTERVRRLLQGKAIDRQPIYGWVSFNLKDEITEHWGSVEAFEDRYEFDIAHLFGGPSPYDFEVIDRIRDEALSRGEEFTPDLLVDVDFFRSPNNPEAYANLIEALGHHKKRGRFCYVQTPGFFEPFNDIFGIENHLMWLMLYPDELAQLYRRQSEWTLDFAKHCIDLGVDMVHISDDWGSQKELLFSPALWWELIYPNMKKVVDYVHSRSAFASLHSDGCVIKVADGIAKLGFDVVHPWQENAGMSYDVYLDKYEDRFAILGGICVQSALGILPREKLETEIRRVFSKLRGKRWICCTTHFVQNHCPIEDLEFAYDLIYRLARSK